MGQSQEQGPFLFVLQSWGVIRSGCGNLGLMNVFSDSLVVS